MRRRAHNGQEVVDQQNALLRGRIPLVALIQTLSVAEYLNFRHAANALGVSQSSVSTRIKALEEDLGVVLFERRHRGVRLTDAGRSFITEVAAGIGHLDLAIKTAGSVMNGSVGHLSIGLLSSIGLGFLPICVVGIGTNIRKSNSPSSKDARTKSFVRSARPSSISPSWWVPWTYPIAIRGSSGRKP